MKKVLAVILCVCIALTLSVSALAEASPESSVSGTKAIVIKDGKTVASDTYTAVSGDDDVTFKADEKTYGKFNKWTIFVVGEDGEYTEAEEGVDYEIVKGDLESTEITLKPIGGSAITVAGNYNDKETDPSKGSGGESTVVIKNGTGTTKDGKEISGENPVKVDSDDTVTVKADKEKGTFTGWTIYVTDENGELVEAEEGIDYIIVDGSLEDETLTVKPINAITIEGNYEEGEEEEEEGTGASVMVRKADATNEAGDALPENKYFDASVGDKITVEANDKYGKFDSWSIYVISDVADLSANGAAITGTAKILNLAATQKAAAAKSGTDYKVVDGSLTSESLTVEILKDEKIVICGNYDGKITDPLSGEATVDSGKKDSNSPGTNDISVMYAVFALLAAGAIVFGVKKQLSK